jgi:hypothetical protein
VSYLGSVLALCAAPFAASSSLWGGVAALGIALGLVTAGKVSAGRAARYGRGARSERLVAERLRPLQELGWQVRHSVVWERRGDIDHVVESPGGLRFAIETKTSRYEPHHMERTRAAARHLSRRGRPCVPVICLARGRGVSLMDRDVVIVSADRVCARLVQLAGGA